MLRLKRVLGLSILLLAFLAALGAVPAAAEETAVPAVAAGCGLNLEALASPAAGISPAVTPESALPDFLSPATGARRGYCRCGCGATCSSDADCGAGGSCVAFITCC